MRKHLIAPSLLASDFTKLGEEMAMINKSEADWLHFDVMDGRFVPNISFGIVVLEAVKKICTKPIDVHLMIVEPEKYIDAFHKAGADVIVVGNAIEKDASLIKEMSDAVHSVPVKI